MLKQLQCACMCLHTYRARLKHSVCACTCMCIIGVWVLSACGLPRAPGWCCAELWSACLTSCMCCHACDAQLGMCGWLTHMSRHVIAVWSLCR